MRLRLPDRVSILNPEDMAENDFGNPVPEWDAGLAKIEPADVSPLSAAEYSIGEDTTITRWRLLLCPVTVARNDSRVNWRGDTFQVIGEVQLVTDHRGRAHHHEAILERVS